MLPLSASGVAVSTNAVIKSDAAGVAWASGGSMLVTAFGANPDGAGTLLRLWETAGQSGHRTVNLPSGMKASRAQPVDLRGRPSGDPISISAGALPFDLHSYAPASFLIQ